MKRSLVLITLALSIGLSACGGGGGGSSSPSVTTPPVIVTPSPTATPVPSPVPVQSSSYANAKASGWKPTTNPDNVITNVLAYGDFRRNGQQMMFAAKLTYDVNLPANQATPSQYGFYSWNPETGKWVHDTQLLSQTTGCVHPRKILVAEFNSDGVPDVFVSCHGYDAAPFAGESSQVILSQPNGTFTTRTMATPHFSHGATAFDVNRDGFVDVVLANGGPNTDTVLVNDGTGNFYENQNLLPATSRAFQNYSVEAIDLNNDGLIDLIFSGDNTSGNTNGVYVLYAAVGTGFTTSNPIQLPNDGITNIGLDFVYQGGYLYALKTSTTQGAYYDKTVVQKIDLNNLTGSIVYNQPTGDRWGTFDNKWTAWFMPYNGALVSPIIGNTMKIQ